MALSLKYDELVPVAGEAPAPPEVVALQQGAIVDHLCVVEAAALPALLDGGEPGGSQRVSPDQLHALLSRVGEFTTKAGGSATNVARGLAGFGVAAALAGARGGDEWGQILAANLRRARVDVSRLRVLPNLPTGRCCILSAGGQRTMRTCLAGAAALGAADVGRADLAGAKWAFLSAYTLYAPGLLEAALRGADAAGADVALDLASFEVVRAFLPTIRGLLEGGRIALCFANEDEAREVSGGAPPEAGLAYLAAHCRRAAVVTLAERGCLVRERGGGATIVQPACKGVQAVDSTGAGDLFAAGFLYALLRGYPLGRCAEVGCIAGGAVVQALGAEMTPATWHWLHARLHGELAGALVRESAGAVNRELLGAYALIERLGRGVVYYGSARLGPGSGHWAAAQALGGRVARLLGSTTWSGGGPGLMQAATEGALSAGGAVGGIRISREAGSAVRSASYLPDDAAVVCRFLSARKVALVDSGVRMKPSDRTAYIFLPGGLGTLDELFELLTLLQLGRLGSSAPVPVVLASFGGAFDGLLAFLQACVAGGTVAAGELRDVFVARSNDAILRLLARHYELEPPADEDGGGGDAVRVSDCLEDAAAAGAAGTEAQQQGQEPNNGVLLSEA